MYCIPKGSLPGLHMGQHSSPMRYSAWPQAGQTPGTVRMRITAIFTNFSMLSSSWGPIDFGTVYTADHKAHDLLFQRSICIYSSISKYIKTVKRRIMFYGPLHQFILIFILFHYNPLTERQEVKIALTVAYFEKLYLLTDDNRTWYTVQGYFKRWPTAITNLIEECLPINESLNLFTKTGVLFVTVATVYILKRKKEKNNES